MAQFNVRTPARTVRQIVQLCEREGATKTQVVLLAIDRLWEQSHQSIHMGMGYDEVCPWCGHKNDPDEE